MKLIRELFKVYVIFAILFFIGRAIFYFLHFDRLSDITLSESLLTFVYGLRMDTIVISIILVFPAIFLSLSPKMFSKYISKFLHIFILSFLLIAIYIECASIPFFAQYDLKPNYLFIEYLEYPQEVIGLLLKDYKLDLFIVFILLIATILIYRKSEFLNFERVFEQSYISRVLLLLPILLVLFLGIRSSLGHRPVNISDALFSTNRVINEITKNSMHSISYAYYSNLKSKDIIYKYGKMDINEAYSLTSNALGIEYKDNLKPFSREVKSKLKLENPKNLVIFIQESLGAQFTGFAGNEVIKRNKSQSDYFTVASLLKPYGYKSSFIYVGEARFDNMKSWYLGNGFDEVIEQKDYVNPIFTSTWGVSDEDLVIKANDYFKEHSKNNEKFVSVMFSSSNHAPFELPDGKIDFIDGIEKYSVNNAIKYADFAIGKFFELARKEDYFKNTVFVVVADHNVRVYGDDIVPINMFQIPAVIIDEGITPQIYKNLTSQSDVLATALDLIGIDLTYPILGNSIFKDNKKEINLMLFDEIYAYRKGNKVAILIPNLLSKTYEYKNEKLIEIAKDELLEKEGLAILYVLNDMYENKLYK